MRVCYFGGYDRDHPRNRVLITGLQQGGAELIECHTRHPIKLIRALSLVVQYLRAASHTDVLVVGASGHAYVPLAWVLASLTRKPLLFDAFVSLFEIWEDESEATRPIRIRGRWAYLLDLLSFRLSDMVLVDTEEHAAYFRETFRLPGAKVRSLPVGADATAVARERMGGFRVMFAGSLLPLHSAETIVRAADLLEDADDVVIELMGGREERRHLESGCSSSRVRFRDPVPYSEYIHALAQADVALGAFGTTEKAKRVIPCKVYDALATGVPLITGDTPAIRRILRHGENAILIPPGNAEELADAIRWLRNDSALRTRLSTQGRETFKRVGTPLIVGRKALAICSALVNPTPAEKAQQ